jgi:ATP-dependent helicase/nuclease subunit A
LEWVLYALSDQKSLHSTFGTGLAEQALNDDLFSLKFYDQPQLKQLSEFVIKLKTDRSLAPPPVGGVRLAPTPAVGVRRLAQVKKSLGWRYRFGDAYILPAKTSVTQLTHRSDEYIKFDYTRALDRQPVALMAAEDPRVAASSESRKSGRAWGWLGTATHLVISQLDLVGSVTEESIEKTKDKLLTDNAITTCVVDQIDIESIVTFFQSELGRMALDNENKVCREWPFTFALPASFVTSAKSVKSVVKKREDETVIVQGIIDMLIRTPQGLVIIDFKTDKVTAGEVHERAKLYRRQLDLYSRAASAIFKSESIAKWLYFLTPDCAIEV